MQTLGLAFLTLNYWSDSGPVEVSSFLYCELLSVQIGIQVDLFLEELVLEF